MTQRRSKESVRAAKKPAGKKPSKSPARKKNTDAKGRFVAGNDFCFKPGNELWRKGLAVTRVYETPEALWEAACGYFQWAQNSPYKEQRSAQYLGGFVYGNVDKVRAFTISGLCLYLGMSREWFNSLPKKEPIFSYVIGMIRDVIWEQKFTAAAAGLLDAGLIARELGIKDGLDTRNLNANLNADAKSPAEVRENLELFNQVLEQAV
jgi:hypothetical protein